MKATADSHPRSVVLLADILNNPEGYYKHIKRTTSSVASAVVWGHRGPTMASFWAHVRTASPWDLEAWLTDTNDRLSMMPWTTILHLLNQARILQRTNFLS